MSAAALGCFALLACGVLPPKTTEYVNPELNERVDPVRLTAPFDGDFIDFDYTPQRLRAETFDECWNDVECKSPKCFLNRYLPPHQLGDGKWSRCLPRNQCHSYSTSDTAPRAAVELCSRLFEVTPTSEHYLLPDYKCKRTGRLCHVDDSQMTLVPDDAPQSMPWQGLDKVAGEPEGFDVFAYQCTNGLGAPCLTPPLEDDRCRAWKDTQTCHDLLNFDFACPSDLVLQGFVFTNCNIRDFDFDTKKQVAVLLKCALPPELKPAQVATSVNSHPRFIGFADYSTELQRCVFLDNLEYNVVSWQPYFSVVHGFRIEMDVGSAEVTRRFQARVSPINEVPVLAELLAVTPVDRNPDPTVPYQNFDSRYTADDSSVSLAVQQNRHWCPRGTYLLNVAVQTVKVREKEYKWWFHLMCYKMDTLRGEEKNATWTCQDAEAKTQLPLHPPVSREPPRETPSPIHSFTAVRPVR